MLVRRYKSTKEHKKQKNKVFCKIECYLQILYSSVSCALLCFCIEKKAPCITPVLILYIGQKPSSKRLRTLGWRKRSIS